jgi:hypothetical protein
MSETFTNPTLLLHKYLVVEFEGVKEVVLAYDYDEDNNALKGKLNPGSDQETYVELYMEDQPNDWYIIEIFG